MLFYFIKEKNNKNNDFRRKNGKKTEFRFRFN